MSSKKDKIQLFSFLIEEIDKKIVSGTIENDYASILEDGRAVGISSYTTNLLVKTAVRNSDKFLELETPILPESCIYTHLSKNETSKISELEKELSELRKSPIIKKQKGRTFFIVTTVILLFLFVLFNAKGLNIRKNRNVDIIIQKDTMVIIELDSTQLEKKDNEVASLQKERIELNQRLKEVTSSLDHKSHENDSLMALITSENEEINRLKSELSTIKEDNKKLAKKYLDN